MNDRNEVKRRDVLKATSTTSVIPVVGATGVAEATSESSEKYKLGELMFVEIAMGQAGLDESDIHTEDSSYHILDDSVLALRYAPTDTFRKQNLVVGYRRKYYSGGTMFGGTETGTIPVKTGYDWRQARSQLVEGSIRHPDFEVKRGGRRSVTVTIDDQTVDVDAGSEASVQLPPVEFTRQTTGETMDTNPIIRIRNNGHVRVYGSREARVFPRDASDGWVKARINGYKQNPDVDTEAAGEAFAAYPPSGK